MKDLFTSTSNLGSVLNAVRDANNWVGNLVGGSKTLSTVSNALQSNVGNILEFGAATTLLQAGQVANSASGSFSYYNNPPGNSVSRSFDFGGEPCFTCPNNAVEGQSYKSILDGENMVYHNGEWNSSQFQTTQLEMPFYTPGGPLKNLGNLKFKELQSITKTFSSELNSFFKSGGLETASKQALKSYKE